MQAPYRALTFFVISSSFIAHISFLHNFQSEKEALEEAEKKRQIIKALNPNASSFTNVKMMTSLTLFALNPNAKLITQRPCITCMCCIERSKLTLKADLENGY